MCSGTPVQPLPTRDPACPSRPPAPAHVRRHPAVAAVVIALAAGLHASCTADTHRDDSPPVAQAGKSEQRHPVRDSLVSNAASMPVQDVDFHTLQSRTPPALTALARFPEDAAVGKLQGDSVLVLGEILDATIVPAVTAGTPGPVVALLDGSYGNVRLFTIDGAPESGFDSFGQGAGEVRAPVVLAADDDAVVVLDAALKVERFGRRGPSWRSLVYPDLVETTEGGRISIHEDILSTERIEQTTRITRLGRSLLAVQVESCSVADFEARHPEPSYRTYFLDAATGRGVGAIAANHQILSADGERAVLYREAPFPQFAVVTLGSLDER